MKKPIAVLANDYHLGVNNGPLIKDLFGQQIALCRKIGADYMLNGGDTFTNRTGQTLGILSDFLEIVEMIEGSGLNAEFIPGNHDKTNADSDRSFLDIIRSKNIRVHRSGKVRIIEGCVVAFIPYFGEERWFEVFEQVEEIRESMYIDGDVKPSAPSFLITHMGVEGVKNNDGSAVVSPIKPGTFQNWTKVLIGHYHDASKLGKNVFFTGSVAQNNYGENITDKGFTVLYNDGSTELVPSEFPRYIKEVIKATDKATLQNVMEKYKPDEDQDHVRLIFVGDRADLQTINKVELAGLGYDVQFEMTETAQAIDAATGDDILEYDRGSMTADFIRYCSANEIKGEKLAYGLQLFKSKI